MLMKKLFIIFFLLFSVNVFSQQKLRCDIDTDKDGVADCFDKCIDSLHNERVDSKGCPLDTDRDGVPDYKDEQLITPSDCQPTDEKGIGVCPEPENSNTRIVIDGNILGYKKYSFASGKIVFDDYVIKMLDNLSNSMKANPSFRVLIAIHGSDIALNNYEKLKSNIINYLSVEKGIDIERLIFQMNVTNQQPYIEIRSPKNGEA